MDKNEVVRCAGRVTTSDPWSLRASCRRPGKVEVGGKWYCKQHAAKLDKDAKPDLGRVWCVNGVLQSAGIVSESEKRIVLDRHFGPLGHKRHVNKSEHVIHRSAAAAIDARIASLVNSITHTESELKRKRLELDELTATRQQQIDEAELALSRKGGAK